MEIGDAAASARFCDTRRVGLRIENASWGSRRPGRVRRWLGAIAFLGTLAAALLIGTDGARLHPGTYSEPNPLAGLGALCMVIGLLASIAWAIAVMSPLEHGAALDAQGVVTVKRGRLTLRGEEKEKIRLDDIESGWRVAPRLAVLRLRDGREISIDAKSPSDAEALLTAAGVAQRVTRLPIGAAFSGGGGGLVGCTALFFGLVFSAGALGTLGAGLVSFARGLMGAGELARSALACVLPLLALAGLLRVRAPRTAVVGADGVAIEGMFGRRFLPYAKIAGVSDRDDGVVIIRKRRFFRRLVLRCAPGGEALHRQITRAMRAFATAGAAVDLDELDRRGRSVAEWMADLKGLKDGGDYRRSALVPERLAEVVEDPTATAERRVAAAVAVAASGDEEARRRVRIAAEGSADVELRAALEQAAEGEVAEEVLERITPRAGRG